MPRTGPGRLPPCVFYRPGLTRAPYTVGQPSDSQRPLEMCRMNDCSPSPLSDFWSVTGGGKRVPTGSRPVGFWPRRATRWPGDFGGDAESLSAVSPPRSRELMTILYHTCQGAAGDGAIQPFFGPSNLRCRCSVGRRVSHGRSGRLYCRTSNRGYGFWPDTVLGRFGRRISGVSGGCVSSAILRRTEVRRAGSSITTEPRIMRWIASRSRAVMVKV